MVTIRSAGLEDVSTIAAINVRGWKAAFRDIIPDDFLDRIDAEERQSFIGQMILTGDPYRVAVAEDVGEVVGYVMLGPPIAEDLEPSTIHELYSLYIEPDRIGTGLGRSLMDHALQHLRNGDWDEAVLWTFQDARRTSRFYERAGWYRDGAEKTEEIPEGNPVIQVRFRIDL
ncbi:MAG: GNAT family N-acetyltransferase [Acidimicrobiia bacterium]